MFTFINNELTFLAKDSTFRLADYLFVNAAFSL